MSWAARATILACGVFTATNIATGDGRAGLWLLTMGVHVLFIYACQLHIEIEKLAREIRERDNP